MSFGGKPNADRCALGLRRFAARRAALVRLRHTARWCGSVLLFIAGALESWCALGRSLQVESNVLTRGVRAAHPPGSRKKRHALLLANLGGLR